MIETLSEPKTQNLAQRYLEFGLKRLEYGFMIGEHGLIRDEKGEMKGYRYFIAKAKMNNLLYIQG